VDKPLQASMLTDANKQHARHAKADREAERAGLQALEAARAAETAANHAPKHQTSTKVSALLLGGQDKRDKVLDKLGMSAKEMSTFAQQPKAFQKLGVFDNTNAPLSARSQQALDAEMERARQWQREAYAAQHRQQQLSQPTQQQQRLRTPQGARGVPNGRLSPQPQPTHQQQRSLSGSQSVPNLPVSSGGGTLPLASNAHGRKILPALPGRAGAAGGMRQLVHAAVAGSSSAGAATGAEAGRWGRVRHQMNADKYLNNGAGPASGGPGSTAAMAKPSNGMSYSASLRTLAGPSASPANLARAYGAATVQAANITAGGGGKGASASGLFSVVMAAKRVRTAAGTSKTVHVLAATPATGPVASIQSGKQVPAALGAGFALQGTSATFSPPQANAGGSRLSGGKISSSLLGGGNSSSESGGGGGSGDLLSGGFRVTLSSPNNPSRQRTLIKRISGGGSGGISLGGSGAGTGTSTPVNGRSPAQTQGRHLASLASAASGVSPPSRGASPAPLPMHAQEQRAEDLPSYLPVADE